MIIYKYIFQRIKIDVDERSIIIDLRPYMDPAPYIVRSVSTHFKKFYYVININYLIKKIFTSNDIKYYSIVVINIIGIGFKTRSVIYFVIKNKLHNDWMSSFRDHWFQLN